MPPSATKIEVRANDVATQFEADTDEQKLSVPEESTYKGQAEVEEAMKDTTVKTSLRDNSIIGSSGSTVNVALGTDA